MGISCKIYKKKFVDFFCKADSRLYAWGDTSFGKTIVNEPRLLVIPTEIPKVKFCRSEKEDLMRPGKHLSPEEAQKEKEIK